MSIKYKDEGSLPDVIKIYESMGRINNTSKANVFNAFKKIYEIKEGNVNPYSVKEIKRFLSSPSTKPRELEKKVGGAMAIIGIVGALIFLAPQISGNVVGNMTNSTVNWTGGILFLIGLVGVFMHLRRR